MAAANPNLADYLLPGAHWTAPNPAYNDLMNTVGHGSGSTSAEVSIALCNVATRTPVVVAFVLQGDEDHVQLGYAPSFYPADITNPQASLDGLTVVLTGREADEVTPIVLPQNAFQRSANRRCHDIATIVGANGHGHAPPVLRTGPHAAGVVTTTEIQARPVHLLPPSAAADAIRYCGDGRMTLHAFYTEFVLGKHDSADPAEQALWAETALWFRMASTNVGGDLSSVRVAPTMQATPVLQRLLTSFSSRKVKAMMAALGVGGPQLSNNQFNVGIQELRQTLTDNHDDTKAFERQIRTKTFQDKHGAALEQRILRFCGVASSDLLPPVHNLLVNAPRGREYSILNCAFAERAAASPLAINSTDAPLASPSLLDQVFRQIAPMNSGLTLGLGLTPFAMVCEGHDEVEALKSLVNSASMVEGGATLTLSDAAALTTNDVRMPTVPYLAVQKLQCWSVVVDVFHGEGTTIADNIRTAVQEVCPHIFRIVHRATEQGTGVGMELVWRIMYEFQQDYFAYLRKMAVGTTGGTVPDFKHIIEKVETSRAAALCTLPATWYTKVKTTPPPEAGREGRPGGGLREQAGLVPRTNPSPDAGLMARFRDCGHASIKSMIGNHNVEYPKVAGKEVCLAWALRGSCSGSCKRKDQHKQYSRDTVAKIHALMDACGVPGVTN